VRSSYDIEEDAIDAAMKNPLIKESELQKENTAKDLLDAKQNQL
jgi:hypothetical protein